MTTVKRLRGRPRGTGKNDTRQLEQVAEFMISNLSLKPTTAMKQVIASRKSWDASDETLLRRWQEKWKMQGAKFLTQARQQAEAKKAAALKRKETVQSDAELSRGFENTLAIFADSPLAKIMADVQKSPWDIFDHTAMKSLMESQRRMEECFRPLQEGLRWVEVAFNFPALRSLMETQKRISESFAGLDLKPLSVDPESSRIG